MYPVASSGRKQTSADNNDRLDINQKILGLYAQVLMLVCFGLYAGKYYCRMLV